MSYDRLRIDPERPNHHHIAKAARCLEQGGFLVVPTETTYALMVLPSAFDAQAAILKLRQLDAKHLWSLMCSDLSQASRFVSMDNGAHRLLKRHLPGPYTFILPACASLPKRLFGKRRDVGVRISEHPVCMMLLEHLDSPLLATSLQFANDDEIAMDNDAIHERMQHHDAIFLDCGWLGIEPTTVVDLCNGEPEVVRLGAGSWND
ncbi:MAG: threonylcarbamoyl-AMP synthase [Zetaproteobacteria bacterium]|nr:threonylcarbamoyl-AMP synthase [Zetaproteobacteria bacterium]